MSSNPAQVQEMNAKESKGVRDPVIACVHQIAAVCNSNDLRSSESSEMASARRSECVCDSRRKSGDSDLSDK